MRRFSAAVLLSALALSGCGGGGGSSPLPAGGGGASSTAAFVIHIPGGQSPASSAAAGRTGRPAYVSPATQSISISVSGESTPVVANLTPNSPNCTPASGSTPLTCTVSVPAPVGNDTFTVTLFQQQNAAGTPLSTGSVAAQISANQTTPVNVVTNGVVASVQLYLANSAPPLGRAATIPVIVDAKDAAGNVIVGPGNYSVTISLSDSDAKYTSLSTASVSAPSASVTLSL